MGYIKDYDSNFISAVYDHDKEKDRKLRRRKNTKHVYNSRYKTAKNAESTSHYEGYWIKYTSFRTIYSKVTSERMIPIYKRVWGKYPISNYRLNKLLEENGGIFNVPNDWNYEDILIGYKSEKYYSNKFLKTEKIPLKSPILKRARWGNEKSNDDYTRNLDVLYDIGTAPGNYRKIR